MDLAALLAVLLGLAIRTGVRRSRQRSRPDHMTDWRPCSPGEYGLQFVGGAGERTEVTFHSDRGVASWLDPRASEHPVFQR
jgi:hypothetical protein